MNTETRQSTLNIEIHYFIKIMSVIAIALGVGFFIVAIAVVKYPILEVRILLSFYEYVLFNSICSPTFPKRH